jgi:hypothetical protein
MVSLFIFNRLIEVTGHKSVALIDRAIGVSEVNGHIKTLCGRPSLVYPKNSGAALPARYRNCGACSLISFT